jgi:hypothetical protein
MTSINGINVTSATTPAATPNVYAFLPDAIYLIIGVVAFVIIFQFVLKPLLKTDKKETKEAYFKKLQERYSEDMELNGKIRVVLPTKTINAAAYKKEKWGVTNKDKTITQTEFYIIKLNKLLHSDFYFLTAVEFPEKLTRDSKSELLNLKNTNFYTIGKGFHVEADLIPMFQNYILDTGVFRISSETTLNELYKNRTKERVLENNQLADTLKIKEVEKDAFLETYDAVNKIKHI